jgi:hypothetical protein
MTTTLTPGSLVFCHSKGIIGRAIRIGEWLRYRRGDTYNHVAILDEYVAPSDADPYWTVIQAEAHGVTRGARLDTVAPGGFYCIVQPPAGADPEKVLEFARSQVGRRYGWVTIASVIVTLLVPFRFFDVMWPDTWICSAVGAECLRAGGWFRSWPDVYQVLPSELWEQMAVDKPAASLGPSDLAVRIG